LKEIEKYLGLKYPITLYEAPEGGFVTEIEELPGCLAEGETLEEAYENIENARRAWIETAYEDGIDIPLPRTEKQYSGKFVVRIMRTLHRELAEQAEREGVSLNQYVESILSSQATFRGMREELQSVVRQSYTALARETIYHHEGRQGLITFPSSGKKKLAEQSYEEVAA